MSVVTDGQLCGRCGGEGLDPDEDALRACRVCGGMGWIKESRFAEVVNCDECDKLAEFEQSGPDIADRDAVNGSAYIKGRGWLCAACATVRV